MLEAALFPKKFTSHFWFFDCCVPFYVGFGSKSGYGTDIHSGSGSVKAKVAVPAIPAPQQGLLQRVPVTGINLIPARSCREDGTCPLAQQWAADAGSLEAISLLLETVLWIRNDFFRIRIRLFGLFRIQIRADSNPSCVNQSPSQECCAANSHFIPEITMMVRTKNTSVNKGCPFWNKCLNLFKCTRYANICVTQMKMTLIQQTYKEI